MNGRVSRKYLYRHRSDATWRRVRRGVPRAEHVAGRHLHRANRSFAVVHRSKSFLRVPPVNRSAVLCAASPAAFQVVVPTSSCERFAPSSPSRRSFSARHCPESRTRSLHRRSRARPAPSPAAFPAATSALAGTLASHTARVCARPRFSRFAPLR